MPPSTPPPGRGLVLVVEDEPTLADVVRRYLQADGFTAVLATSGSQAQAVVLEQRPVLVVLDIGLPDIDGLTLCRQWRAAGDWTPVVFLTARDLDVDRILGLEMGGDDYLVKPFNPRELMARVRAVLRRSAGPADSATLRLGAVVIEPDQRRVWVQAADSGAAPREIVLTATEFDLLLHLARQPRRVFDRAGLLGAVWGYAGTAGLRTVDVHVAALRAKLGSASPIRTVRGVGYSADPG